MFLLYLEPEPSTGFKVDNTITSSSKQIPLLWIPRGTRTDEYEVYLDDIKIKTLASNATNFTIASTNDADGGSPTPLEPSTTYTCKLVAKGNAADDCETAEAEPQIVGCSTAQDTSGTISSCASK